MKISNITLIGWIDSIRPIVEWQQLKTNEPYQNSKAPLYGEVNKRKNVLESSCDC
jgi:hypothetical protein